MFATDQAGHVTDLGLAPLVREDGPRSAVVISRHPEIRLHRYSGFGGAQAGRDARTAAALAVVLRAVADQVSRETLHAFGASTARELTLRHVAMAHRADDSGVLGDVFEYAVLAALNDGEPEVLQLVTDGLWAIGERGEVRGAVTTAAENGRARAAIPGLPPGQKYSPGTPGRRPLLKNLLAAGDTRTWKNDLVVLTGDGAVGVTIKSNPAALPAHLRSCQDLRYPPRLAIVPVHANQAGIRRHRETGTMVVSLPVDIPFLSLLQATLTTVQAAFARHLSEPRSALVDPGGVMGQFYRWRHRTVQDVLNILDQVAQAVPSEAMHRSAVTPVADLTDTPGAPRSRGGLVVVASPFDDPEARGRFDAAASHWAEGKIAMRRFEVDGEGVA